LCFPPNFFLVGSFSSFFNETILKIFLNLFEREREKDSTSREGGGAEGKRKADSLLN